MSPQTSSASSEFLTASWLVLGKDLRIEWRTREIVVTAVFFAFLVTVMASLAFSGMRAVETAPGAIWLPVSFASVLALTRTWQRERDDDALTGLLLSPMPRAALYAGKAAGVCVFLAMVFAVVSVSAAMFFHVQLLPVLGPLLLLEVMGVVGLASFGTLFGAMTVRTRARDLVLASVLLPLLWPVLLTGVSATRELLEYGAGAELGDYYALLGVFDILGVVGGLALFGKLIEE